MSAVAKKILMSEVEYLEGETYAKEKHEYIDGEIFAMAGVSERHNRIAGNIFFHWRQATRGRSCRVFMSDMKLRIADGLIYYYPDVMLVCDDQDADSIFKTAPCFIAEVLSPSTATTDQREKWSRYRHIASLRYYLMVDSQRLRARLCTRVEGDHWIEQIIGREEAIDMACGDARLTLSLEDLYEDTGLLTE